MTTLVAAVLDAYPSVQTASPGVTFRLRIDETSGARTHAIALRCHLRIEPRGRRYTKEEQERLYELFGDTSQWDRTLRGVTWAHSTVIVPSFDRRIDVDLPVVCTYDLEVASAKYLHAIRDGDVPLLFLFSGTVFRPAFAPEALRRGRAEARTENGASECGAGGFAIEPVPWDLEASYRLPAQVWHAAMDRFFPGGGWLRLERDTIDRLQAFRGRHAVVSWDEALDLLLHHAEQEEPA